MKKIRRRWGRPYDLDADADDYGASNDVNPALLCEAPTDYTWSLSNDDCNDCDDDIYPGEGCEGFYGIYERVSTGTGHACALASDGWIQCWGDDSFGQSSPPVGRFSQMDVGGDHSCAVNSDGEVQCWGYDNKGQATPPTEGTFVAVSTAEEHSCALDTDGEIVCWSSDSDEKATPPEGASIDLCTS
jgi:hypothetical protein